MTPRTYYSTPVSTATPAEVLYRDTNGRTFSVRHNDYLRLSKQREAIAQEEAAITAIQFKQKAYSDSIESERTYLDRTNQYEIDAFNAKIDNLNAAHAQLKQRIDIFNRSIDAFNSELERVGTPAR
jgi:peptidoglycan hydrolase CwlO-like protein